MSSSRSRATTWKGLDTLVEELDTPIMLDEGVDSLAAVDRVIGYRGRVWAHLKLVKLGGIVPVLEAARRLRAHGVPFMLGQMNEGSAATAAAIHIAMAVRAPMAELYGADGLRDDPVTGVWYERGGACVKQGAGLGTALDPPGAETDCPISIGAGTPALTGSLHFPPCIGGGLRVCRTRIRHCNEPRRPPLGMDGRDPHRANVARTGERRPRDGAPPREPERTSTRRIASGGSVVWSSRVE